MIIRNARIKDKDFIVKANHEVDEISGTHEESKLEQNYLDDLFCPQPKFSCIVVENNNEPVAYMLYSHVYWANTGYGLYLSNAYVSPTYRNQGILKMMLEFIKAENQDVVFMTAMVGKENSLMQSIMKNLGGEDVNLITYSIKI